MRARKPRASGLSFVRLDHSPVYHPRMSQAKQRFFARATRPTRLSLGELKDHLDTHNANGHVLARG